MGIESVIRALMDSVHMAAHVFAELMKKEYERGVADGKRQAVEELRARVERALQLSDGVKVADVITAQVVRTATEPSRAQRGSVGPKVLDALRGSVQGKKPSEIAGQTGVPENSVRGMLNKLRKEAKVVKRGEVWFLAKPSDLFGPDENESTVSTTSDTEENGNPGAGGAGAD